MKSAFWQEPAPVLSEYVTDLYVADGGVVTRVRAPRPNPDRSAVVYHDIRSTHEKQRDPRSAREIAKTHPSKR